ncbi:DUF2017 family protein [Psychromicrobium xiongbiense]|uniref:DUF2017 family protein n=1 Tax=Psychromicrobium xiongbiense TaxID=3051184 RepID=UPI0025566E13|nr:DUF2017 family protein [Psychromicrobium sp. YIM S02556]
MTRGFVIRGGRIHGRIGEDERHLLQGLCSAVIELLQTRDPGQDGTEPDPLAVLVGWQEDPGEPHDLALKWLLPSGITQPHDAEDSQEKADAAADAAAEWRRLSESTVRQGKVATLRAAALLLEPVELNLEANQAEILAKALNSIRLTLAARIGLDSPEAMDTVFGQAEGAAEDPAARDASDHDAENESLLALFRLVAAIHDSLVMAMLELLDLEPDPGEGAR